MNSSMPGPRPHFDEAQVRRALELVGERQPIGRKKLAEKLGIGEGSIRTILGRLKDKGLISSTSRGHVLTKRGKRDLRKKSRKFLRLDTGALTVGEVNVATMVKGVSEKVKLGVEQRDEAIKAGADGATVLVFKGGKLELPDKEIEVEAEVRDRLLEFFRPSDGDVIIIGTADDVIDAERGALSAAESLSD